MANYLDFETCETQLNARNRIATLARFNFCDDICALTSVANFLGNSIPAVCESAVDALIRCANLVAAQAAAVHIHSKVQSERGHAMTVLSSLGEHALMELTSLLQDVDPEIREFAVDTLINLPKKKSADLLYSTLQAEAQTVSVAAAAALGELDQKVMDELLFQAFQDASGRIGPAILTALENMDSSSALAVITQNSHKMSDAELCIAIQAVGFIGQSDPALVWSFLADCCGSANIFVRNAIFATTSNLLAAELKFPDGYRKVFSKMVESITQYHDPDIRLAVRGLTASSDPKVVQRLCSFLANISDREARDLVILDLLQSGLCNPLNLVRIAKKHQVSDVVRLLALQTLVKNFDPSTPLPVGIEQDLEQIIQESGHELIFITAMCVLLCVSPSKSIPLIVSFYKNASIVQKGNLIQALSDCRPDELTLLMIDGYEDRQLRLCLLELFQLEKNRTFFGNSVYGQLLLTASLGDEDWMIRSNIVNLLAHSRSVWAFNLMRHACFDLDARVRLRAVDAVLKVDVEKIDPNWLEGYRIDESIPIQNLVNSYLGNVAHRL